MFGGVALWRTREDEKREEPADHFLVSFALALGMGIRKREHAIRRVEDRFIVMQESVET